MPSSTKKKLAGTSFIIIVTGVNLTTCPNFPGPTSPTWFPELDREKNAYEEYALNDNQHFTNLALTWAGC